MNISWPVLLLIGGVLIAVVLVLVLPIPRSRTNVRTRADRGPTPAMFRDEDRYWYAGFFYHNPDDPDGIETIPCWKLTLVRTPVRNSVRWKKHRRSCDG